MVEQRVTVQRRRWFDFFRVTHGVLAATDRRLIYVGVPPEELLRHESEPLELDQSTYSYDRPITASSSPGSPWTVDEIEISNGVRQLTLGVTARDRARLDSTLAVVQRRQGELRAAADAERRAIEAAAAASRRAIYHLVQPGEALATIAARYGIDVDSLRTWNQLTSDRITAGKRLLVRPPR